MQQDSRGVILLAGAGITPDNAADLVRYEIELAKMHGTGCPETSGKLDQSKFEILKNNLIEFIDRLKYWWPLCTHRFAV